MGTGGSKELHRAPEHRLGGGLLHRAGQQQALNKCQPLRCSLNFTIHSIPHMPLHLEGYSEEQQMLEESRHWGLQGRPGGNVTACWRHALKGGGRRGGGSWVAHGGPPHAVFTRFITSSSLPPMGFRSPLVLPHSLPERHSARTQRTSFVMGLSTGFCQWGGPTVSLAGWSDWTSLLL